MTLRHSMKCTGGLSHRPSFSSSMTISSCMRNISGSHDTPTRSHDTYTGSHDIPTLCHMTHTGSHGIPTLCHMTHTGSHDIHAYTGSHDTQFTQQRTYSYIPLPHLFLLLHQLHLQLPQSTLILHPLGLQSLLGLRPVHLQLSLQFTDPRTHIVREATSLQL